MARTLDKQQAIKLRLEGQSYSQIKKELKVSKSTLSGWLRDYPLSNQKIRELRDWNQQRIEKYIKTRKSQKEKILKEIYEQEKTKIFPISKRDLFIAGLFLYWGEGGKTSNGEVILSNTNPAIIKFFIYWLTKSLKIDRAKIKIKLHLYKDMDIDKKTKFWSNELNINKPQFSKPYIKNSNKSDITYKNGFGHGTCNVRLSNAILYKRVLMGLKAIEDKFNQKRV